MAVSTYDRLLNPDPDSPLRRERPKPTGPKVVFNKYWLRGLLLAVAIGIWREQPLLTIAGLIGLSIGGGQLLWLKFCLSGVEYERKVGASHAFWGEDVHVTVRIANKKPLPLSWLLTEDQVSDDRMPIRRGERLEQSISFPATIKSLLPMLPYGQIVRHYTAQCRHRGAIDFGPTMLESGDLLGYATRTITLPERDRLLVYPKLFELDVPNLRSVRLVGPQRVDRIILTDPSRTIGVREYQPGDPLRHVEWRASARAQELLVRIFEPTTDPATAIFLNSEVPVADWDFYDPPELEFCVSLAASVAKWMLDRGYPVGLYGNGEPTGDAAVRLPASGHPDQLRRILELLALATPLGPVRRRGREWWEDMRFRDISADRGAVRWRLPLGELLLREAARLPFEVSIVIVTTMFDSELLAACHEVQRRRPVTVLYVQTPLGSPEAPLAGLNVITVPYIEDWQEHDRLLLAA
ncbi:MAG TPA: DUF58 domain-containing protein [Chloroflexota bacterium]|jgi:uncharacterized protein (DUF58 family)|nr:DUF58 domain-containing protein [Chloroflexota bacterium]